MIIKINRKKKLNQLQIISLVFISFILTSFRINEKIVKKVGNKLNREVCHNNGIYITQMKYQVYYLVKEVYNDLKRLEDMDTVYVELVEPMFNNSYANLYISDSDAIKISIQTLDSSKLQGIYKYNNKKDTFKYDIVKSPLIIHENFRHFINNENDSMFLKITKKRDVHYRNFYLKIWKASNGRVDFDFFDLDLNGNWMQLKNGYDLIKEPKKVVEKNRYKLRFIE